MQEFTTEPMHVRGRRVYDLKPFIGEQKSVVGVLLDKVVGLMT